MIIISTAENQIEQSKAWSRYGRARYLGNLGFVKRVLKSVIKSF